MRNTDRHPDDVARLREIKRLLDRIQRLPRIAGIPGNGLGSGLHPVPADGPGNGLATLGPPHPTIDEDVDARPAPEPAEPPPLNLIEPPLELPHRDDERSDYWESEVKGQSRALVPVRPAVSVGISPWVFIAATAVNTVVAAVLAVVITLGVARREPPTVEAEKAMLVKPAPEPPSEPRLVELLPVGSLTEPLRLEALK